MKPISNSAIESASIVTHSKNIELDGELNELYKKILEFDIDGKPVEFSFSCRLARENGWCDEYAGRVLIEYKRFLFLAVAADHSVTPSSPIDKAWHLHLTYTSSYWDRLCGDTLGRPIHHQPTQGGPEETRKYRCQYLQTLASYESIFGTPPNPDIWPSLPDRHAEPSSPPPANKIRNWLARKLAKGNRTQVKRIALFGSIVTAASILFMIYLANAWEPIEGYSSAFKILIILTVASVAIFVGITTANKCPACGRTRALKRTGAVQMQGIWKPKLDEWHCKYCDYRNWEERPSCG